MLKVMLCQARHPQLIPVMQRAQGCFTCSLRAHLLSPRVEKPKPAFCLEEEPEAARN